MDVSMNGLADRQVDRGMAVNCYHTYCYKHFTLIYSFSSKITLGDKYC